MDVIEQQERKRLSSGIPTKWCRDRLLGLPGVPYPTTLPLSSIRILIIVGSKLFWFQWVSVTESSSYITKGYHVWPKFRSKSPRTSYVSSSLSIHKHSQNYITKLEKKIEKNFKYDNWSSSSYTSTSLSYYKTLMMMMSLNKWVELTGIIYDAYG